MINKLCKVDVSWRTQKVVLQWEIDTVQQFFNLSEDHTDKFIALLDTVPPRASRLSRRHWNKLIRNLQRKLPAIYGAAGMFDRLQNALKTAQGRQISLSVPFHNALTI